MENKTFKIEGAKEVESALKNLPIDIQAKLIKGFLRKVGKKFIVDPLRTIIRYNEKLNNSIQVVSGSKNELKVSAGVTGSGYMLRWLDLGTKVRQTKKGANRGQIIGKHQIQPHIESQIEPIVKYVSEEMTSEINKSLSRRLKKLK